MDEVRFSDIARALPPVFLLPTQLSDGERQVVEDTLPSLTRDIRKASIVLGKINRRERAKFELRRLKLDTVPLDEPQDYSSRDNNNVAPLHKRQKTSPNPEQMLTPSTTDSAVTNTESAASVGDIVTVLRLAWLDDCKSKECILPFDPYALYRGRKTQPSLRPPAETTSTTHQAREQAPAQAKVPNGLTRESQELQIGASEMTRKSPAPPALLHETTSEHNIILPPVPEYLHTTYSCQRPTLVDPPNIEFIESLKEIRTFRLLQGDQVGVRAYSTTIAAIAAYPHPLQTPQEVARLPGCGTKIAQLFSQWQDRGQLNEAVQARSDPRLSVLHLFYNIWGVGDTTARDLYQKGWKDLDDVVEHGWPSLTRVQQIGVKYYDEFLLKIPCAEVEAIATKIASSARRIDPGVEFMIVGGYRRGKPGSGDVDVVLSHRDEAITDRLVRKVVMQLERDRCITHTLSLSLRNSERGQVPLPWKGDGGRRSGFDTLDKALVVWQDPGQREAPHRRVDIIVSPWKTVGCAVLGWSGGNTFQRDLRRYCKMEKALKFDSSGVRSRENGVWVDLEQLAPDMEAAERRVFAGLGLTWRPPHERCTC